jgi:hypothetical protein
MNYIRETDLANIAVWCRVPSIHQYTAVRFNTHKSGCVLASVLCIGGCTLEPFAEVRHPALGYDHGIVRHLFRLLELMPSISEGSCDYG